MTIVADQDPRSAGPLLSVRGVSKRYPGVVALDDVSFSAVAGEIHALIGANGAGKSTLMNVLSGATGSSEGSIVIDGVSVQFRSPADAKAAGVSTVYQEFSLVPQLSVARNIYLGREPLTRWNTVDEPRMIADARDLLAEYGIALDPRREVSQLTVAQQQMVEIARALSVASRILILDEPSAVLSLTEQEKLFEIMRLLRARGVLILYVSHRLEEIIALADRLTVLRSGRMVGTQSVAGLEVADIVRLMIGGEAKAARPMHAIPEDAAHYRITYTTGRGGSELAVRAGELVGIAGLVGAGRTTFGRALAGMTMPGARIALTIDGRARTFASCEEAIASGVVYLTEDRKKDGIFGNLDLVRNASASALISFCRLGFLKARNENAASADVLKRLHLVARDLDVPISSLSGGNQQKVIFGRALLTLPKLLICDEPTRGVDVGAKAEIHAALRDMAERGCAVIVISSEIEELLATSSRIVVMRDYCFLQEFKSQDTTEHDILQVALSGQAIPNLLDPAMRIEPMTNINPH